MFHNIRDRFGKFTKKGKGAKRTVKKNPKLANTKKKQFNTIISAFLLDDSGSMRGKQKGVVEGFNGLIEKGRKDAKDTGINGVETVAFFSNPGSLKFIENVKELYYDGDYTGTEKKGKHAYGATGGGTALWQSTAELIEQVETVQKKHPKSNVILTIFTDGGENASTGKWRVGEAIKALIEKKQKEGWVVTYIGAEHTMEAAQATAKSMGIFASNATNYTNTSRGIHQVVTKMAVARSSYSHKALVGEATQDGFFQDEDC